MNKKYLLISVVVGLILITTAILKWVFPSPRDPILYFIVGAAEAAFGAILIVCRRSWRVWALFTLVLSLGAGFSLYTTIFELPCSCFGAAFEFPRGVPLSLNGLMFAAAWRVLGSYPSHPIELRRIILFFSVFCVTGFVIAGIYYGIT